MEDIKVHTIGGTGTYISPTVMRQQNYHSECDLKDNKMKIHRVIGGKDTILKLPISPEAVQFLVLCYSLPEAKRSQKENTYNGGRFYIFLDITKNIVRSVFSIR